MHSELSSIVCTYITAVHILVVYIYVSFNIIKLGTIKHTCISDHGLADLCCNGEAQGRHVGDDPF